MKKIITILIASLLAFGCQYGKEPIHEGVETGLPAGSVNVKWISHESARYANGYGWLSFELKGECYIYLNGGRSSVLSQSKCDN